MFCFRKHVRDFLMSSKIAIKVDDLSKCYQIYDKPRDRLKQFVFPRVNRLLPKFLKNSSLTRYFKEFWAVKNISLEISKGETVGIIGRNGCGKSTLLQMICGTLTPTSGNIQTYGRIAALLELGSGFNSEFTGRENIIMNATVLGLRREEVEARFDDIVAFADIGSFIEQPLKTYSSGMVVRLAFAVIAHVDADILVVDEALAVGDAFFTQKCMRFLRNFMKTGTVLFVSHDTSAIRNLCTRAVWIEEGRVLQEGLPKDVCEKYLEAFFEAQQGKSTTTRIKQSSKQEASDTQDPRQEFINNSNLRNDIKLFKFDSETASFGKGQAQITDVQFLDVGGTPLSWIVGGENVILRIEAIANKPLHSPIVGFFINDNLGQALFGDNTWLRYFEAPIACAAGQELVASFEFQMPRLSAGDYSITVALADGTQDEHVHHHWLHSALSFRSESTSVSSGIIGIPIQDIRLEIINTK